MPILITSMLPIASARYYSVYLLARNSFGNSCFLNSALQLLFSLLPIRQYFINFYLTQEPPPDENQARLFYDVGELFFLYSTVPGWLDSQTEWPSPGEWRQTKKYFCGPQLKQYSFKNERCRQAEEEQNPTYGQSDATDFINTLLDISRTEKLHLHSYFSGLPMGPVERWDGEGDLPFLLSTELAGGVPDTLYINVELPQGGDGEGSDGVPSLLTDLHTHQISVLGRL